MRFLLVGLLAVVGFSNVYADPMVGIIGSNYSATPGKVFYIDPSMIQDPFTETVDGTRVVPGKRNTFYRMTQLGAGGGHGCKVTAVRVYLDARLKKVVNLVGQENTHPGLFIAGPTLFSYPKAKEKDPLTAFEPYRIEFKAEATTPGVSVCNVFFRYLP